MSPGEKSEKSSEAGLAGCRYVAGTRFGFEVTFAAINEAATGFRIARWTKIVYVHVVLLWITLYLYLYLLHSVYV